MLWEFKPHLLSLLVLYYNSVSWCLLKCLLQSSELNKIATKARWQKLNCSKLWLLLYTSGIPDDVISKGRDFKLVTEVIQNGDEYTWIQYYPNNHVVTNKFIVGKESDMETVGGKKFKVWHTCTYESQEWNFSVSSVRFLNASMFIKCIIWWKLILVCPPQGVVSMEGSKLAISFPKYHHTSEISGGKLVEVRYYHICHCEIICNSCKVAKVPLLWFTDLHSN